MNEEKIILRIDPKIDSHINHNKNNTQEKR